MRRCELVVFFLRTRRHPVSTQTDTFVPYTTLFRSRIRRICEMRVQPFANDHLASSLNAAADCALAMQTFILSAEAAGLGCCTISAVRNHAQALADLLELPEWVFPVAGLCLGWPAREGFLSARPARKGVG